MAAGRRIIKIDIGQKLSSIFNDFKEKELMSKHTTLCLGGPADYFIEVKNDEELILLLKIINEYEIPFYIIGSGSNLLFCDEGFKGIIIKLVDEFEKVEVIDTTLVCGAGSNLTSVVKQSVEHSLSGLEHFIAIPGTVGGAVCGNAGLKDIWIDSVIDTIEIFSYQGKKKILVKKEMDFEYRNSNLKNCIITKVKFVLKKADKNGILNTVSQEIEKRKYSQPLGTKNAGCIFKNPQGSAAGSLIDSLGLKNYSIGNIQISDVHANFFINKGFGSSNDMLLLINFVKEKIKDKFNIELKTEIKIIK
ncbi:MAG: UDP-N-acetylmuramate dehydrogenase [Endomicrobiia bacterium]|nr:UDP-N-acetylmuramate dehydrogenase [Endomicrobiaceae bacterium]MDD3922769.1 UDP-N-acetylmuramate dehydrogenase [Endomicrobiaceae bacterium]